MGLHINREKTLKSERNIDTPTNGRRSVRRRRRRKSTRVESVVCGGSSSTRSHEPEDCIEEKNDTVLLVMHMFIGLMSCC